MPFYVIFLIVDMQMLRADLLCLRSFFLYYSIILVLLNLSANDDVVDLLPI